MNFGIRLKEARKAKGFTQQDVAELVGVKKNTIAGYELGNREPDVMMIKKLVEVLGVSSAYLLEIPDFDNSTDQADRTLSQKAFALAKAYDGLSDVGQEMIDSAMVFAEKYHKAK